VHTLEEVIRSRKFHPSVQVRLQQAQDGAENGPETEACKADAQYRDAFREAVAQSMTAEKLDAFVYPTWSNPPRLIGDLNTPAGDNSQVFSPTTGWPAINVPMGYTRGTLPIGMTIFGRAWSEATLLKFAYAYEQATRHRHAPASTPPLR
jgi:Asp-tRNA(Asn)/Glu-tRNA(Gln) amidotransferase A subunit family amidase